MSKTVQMHPLVCVILLNYGNAEETLNCLESLQHLEYPNYQVIVVDNHSEDDSVKKLKAAQKKYDFILLESEANNGYSAGNNLAIQYVLDREEINPLATYIWLLNNDTTVEPRSLSIMLEITQKTGGLVGSLILYPDRSYQQVGTRLNWVTGGSRGYPENSLQDGMEIECLSGASMLVPLNAFKRLGLLDESFFLYFEDAEFCLRAANKNYPINLALRARVYHKEGSTTGKNSLATQYYFYRNRLRLLSMYAVGMEKFTIYMYTGFRLFRSLLKSWFNASDEQAISAQIQQLAVKDFYEGVSGPCPHNLQDLLRP